MTPPLEKPREEKRKGSVTFDLPPTPSVEKEKELLSPSEPNAPTSIDICAQAVPDNMLVALFDRSSEMKELVHHNKAYFKSLEHHLGEKWSRFLNTLYCERSNMPDVEWIGRISKALYDVPPLLEKFKELVGYLGDDDDDDDDNISSYSSEQYYFSDVDLTRIRDFPERLERFHTSYPQFFINCKQTMDNEQYTAFTETLFSKRTVMPDYSWESSIYNQLHCWQNILEQLQEIVAYEIEE
ncbi:hypothetical protein K501DRAFT_175798 [Backusella circina FSU 941]|nr:hypothetical protein K501DRAFT_175798 [Backusella circina FSU 941]